MPLPITGLIVGLAVALMPWTPAGAQQWELNVEALYWNLERDDAVPITVDTATSSVATDSNDLNAGFEPGARTTLSWTVGPNAQVQLSGFWVNTHSESRTVTDPDSTGVTPNETLQAVTLRSYGAGQGFAGDWRHIATLESDTWGFEGNYVRKLDEFAGFTPSILLGLRFIRFGENMSLFVLDNNPDRGIAQFISTMDTDTTNDLYGAQVGIAVERALVPWVTVNANVRAGLFANDAEQDSFFNDGEVGRSVALSRSDTGLATMVQAGLGASFTLMPNITLGINYELAYFSGLALGPDNFAQSLLSAQFGDPLTFNNDGNIFYHGGNARLTIWF